MSSLKTLIKTNCLVMVIIAAAILPCWIWNLTKFIDSDFDMPIKNEIVHGIGLIPPIALVTCWFPNYDKKVEE